MTGSEEEFAIDKFRTSSWVTSFLIYPLPS